MKHFSKSEGLQKSTKLTLVGCACFLVLTVLIVVFLMFFPIQQSDQTVIVRSAGEPAQTTVAETYHVEEFDWEDLPHTISTWSAGVNGFHRDLDEFNQTEPETTEITAETTREATESETVATEQEGDTIPVQTDMPQTTTETKPVPDPEPDEPTAPPLPPVTDAPATEPPDTEPDVPEE